MTDEPQKKRRGRPPSGAKVAVLRCTLELLRERGVAAVTTRAVAERAGVSEGSIFYHYGDRVGLLMAVFTHGLQPLQLGHRGESPGADHGGVLLEFSRGVERFLDQALPVLTAAQSDNELRDALARHMEAHDLGPHRGVDAVAAYIAAEQQAGRARRDIDPAALAAGLVGSAFIRAYQQQMLGHTRGLPPTRAVAEGLATAMQANA